MTAHAHANAPAEPVQREWELPWPGEGRLLQRPHAAAILVPPIALYLGALLTIYGEATRGQVGTVSWPVLRSLILMGLHLPLLYAVRTTAGGIVGEDRTQWIVLVASVLLTLCLNALLPGASPTLLILALITFISVVALELGDMWRERWQRHRRVEALLVVPDADAARGTLDRLRGVPGVEITGVVLAEPGTEPPARLRGRPVYDDLPSLPPRLRHAVVASPKRNRQIRPWIAQLVAQGFEVASESAVVRVAEGRVDSEKADPLNLLLSQPNHALGDAVARVRDIIISVPIMILFSPVFVAIALIIKLDTPGTVFYRQTRAGKRGKPIEVIKFRTMVKDAESQSGPVWAREGDARVTRVGRILRRFRLDELPQFWNVIRGEMSLVGPRPERAHFFDELRAQVPIFELRTAVRPGITGWAQVRAPYASDAEDARVKLDFDLFYLCNRSFSFDLAILFETVGTALSGRGAL